MAQKTEKIIGQRIKELRTYQKLSLRNLADRCGLSANTISLIERGENSATISTLEKIAKGLNISIKDLFNQSINQSVFHLRNQQGLKIRQANLEFQSLGFGLQDRWLDPYFVTLFPEEKYKSKIISHPGQEFVYCLSGELEYIISNQVYDLKMGDSLLFDATHPHGWRKSNDKKVDLILILQSIGGNYSAQQLHIK